MALVKYDLHCHSTASDGALAPIELFSRAQQQQIEVLALTDHDTVSGVAQLIDMQGCGQLLATPRILAGVEFTAQQEGRVLHIVGLGIDVTHPLIEQHEQQLKLMREQRAEAIAERLSRKHGFANLLDQVKQLASGVPGRPHFSAAMVKSRLVSSEAEAFKKYLGAGKAGDVKVNWPELQEIVSLVHNTGGVAVFAHPTKYKMTMSKLRGFVAAFVNCGGDAIEVSYPGVNSDQQAQLLRIAKQHQLAVSAGSDFHTPENHWSELGKFPHLDTDLPHVLEGLLAAS